MSCIIRTIFNLVHDLKKSNRRFIPRFPRCYWINDFNITIMKMRKLVVVLVNNNQILIRSFTFFLLLLLPFKYEKSRLFILLFTFKPLLFLTFRFLCYTLFSNNFALLFRAKNFLNPFYDFFFLPLS